MNEWIQKNLSPYIKHSFNIGYKLDGFVQSLAFFSCFKICQLFPVPWHLQKYFCIPFLICFLLRDDKEKTRAIMWFIGDHKFRKEKTRGSRTDDVTELGPFTLVHLLIAERCEALCRQANSLYCIIFPDLHTLEKGRHFGLSQLHRMKIREGEVSAGK